MLKDSLGPAREAAELALHEAGLVGADGWRLDGIDRIGPAAALVRLINLDGATLLLEWHDLEGGPARAMCEGEFHAAGYRRGRDAASWEDVSEERREQIARACEALANRRPRVDLQAAASEPPSEPPPADVPFRPDAIEAWLAPQLARGDELTAGWRLDDIFGFGPEEIALLFAGPGDEPAARFKLRMRDEGRPAASRTTGLDLLYPAPPGRLPDPERKQLHATLAARLGELLDELDRGERFVAVQRPADARPDVDRPTAARSVGQLATRDDPPPPALNLALPAPCQLECVFCSVRDEVWPIVEPTDDYLETLRSDIRQGARRGTRVLRLNGLDPLRAPYVFGLMDLAWAEGYEELHLLSTFLPVAEPGFADRLFAHLPRRVRFYVPIYGSTADVHDAVTGVPGSFAQLRVAVEALRERMAEARQRPDPPDIELLFTTVLVRQNLADLRRLGVLVRSMTRSWEVHLAFPNTAARTDGYHDASVRARDALEAAYPPDSFPVAEIALGEVPLCTALDHQRATGHPLLTRRRMQARRRELSGTFYETTGITHSQGGGQPIAFTSATVACPHADRCALRSCCTAKLYAAYVQAHGWDELRPVSRRELEGLPKVLAFVDASR